MQRTVARSYVRWQEERKARNVSKTHGPHNGVLRVGSKNDDIIT